jgi:hypothetical protein
MAHGIARQDIRLYQFAPPDKKRPVAVLTRDSSIAYLSTVTVARSRPPFAECHPRWC